MAERIPAFDLYLELEVHYRASTETIEAAYRSLAKRYHPDTSTGREAAAQRMVRLNVARDWLTDLERRARYDAMRTTTRASREAENGWAREHDEDAAGDKADRLLPDAVAVIQEYDRVSASLLQRRLHVGYARAARLIDQLEARGYVGAFEGSNARLVHRVAPSSPESNGDSPPAPNPPASRSETLSHGPQATKGGCLTVAIVLTLLLAELVRMSTGLGRQTPNP